MDGIYQKILNLPRMLNDRVREHGKVIETGGMLGSSTRRVRCNYVNVIDLIEYVYGRPLSTVRCCSTIYRQASRSAIIEEFIRSEIALALMRAGSSPQDSRTNS